jgi:hypothetical protein
MDSIRNIMFVAIATSLASGCGSTTETATSETTATETTESASQAVVVNGIKGEYFSNDSLSGTPAHVRIDNNVDFNWGSNAPIAGFPADNFSVRWTGKVTPQYSQTYTFYLNVYDGARLWINNQLIIDDWAWDEGEEQGTIALTAGTAYDIKLEYKEGSGAAVAQLSWSSANQAKQRVPQSALTVGEPPPLSLFNLDFESENATCWGTRNSSGYTTSPCGAWASVGKFPASLVTGEKARSGTRAFKATFGTNEDSAMARLTTDVNHVFVRFYEYYDTDFDFAAGMKTLRLQSFNEAAGVNYYDLIAYSTAVPTSGSYDHCGINNMRSIALSRNGSFRWAEPNLSLQRNRWYAIETEVKLNTPGVSNGEVRMWVDGQNIMQVTGIDIRGTDTHNINRISIGGWYSNGAGGNNPCPNPAVASRRYIDDVVVATQYIGP